MTRATEKGAARDRRLAGFETNDDCGSRELRIDEATERITTVLFNSQNLTEQSKNLGSTIYESVGEGA